MIFWKLRKRPFKWSIQHLDWAIMSFFGLELWAIIHGVVKLANTFIFTSCSSWITPTIQESRLWPVCGEEHQFKGGLCVASLALCTPWTGGMWVCPGHQEQCCHQVSRWLVARRRIVYRAAFERSVHTSYYSVSQPYKLRGHVLGLGTLGLLICMAALTRLRLFIIHENQSNWIESDS